MQLSVALDEKLDQPLARMCNDGFDSAGRVALLVRCEAGSLESVSTEILSLGGTVRHHLRLVNAVAVWVPLSAVGPLAQRADVSGLELEQNFTIA